MSGRGNFGKESGKRAEFRRGFGGGKGLFLDGLTSFCSWENGQLFRFSRREDPKTRLLEEKLEREKVSGRREGDVNREGRGADRLPDPVTMGGAGTLPRKKRR